MPDENGVVAAHHFENMKKSGVEIKEYFLPDLPLKIKYLWDLWKSMNSERPNNGMSVSALTTKFMYDYLSVYSIKPIPIEIQILKSIDQEYLEAINGHSKSSN